MKSRLSAIASISSAMRSLRTSTARANDDAISAPPLLRSSMIQSRSAPSLYPITLAASLSGIPSAIIVQIFLAFSAERSLRALGRMCFRTVRLGLGGGIVCRGGFRSHAPDLGIHLAQFGTQSVALS